MGYTVTLKEYIKDDIIPSKERWFLRMKVISLTCPGCGANLSIEDGHKQCFCQYCGMKIMLDDESITYRTVDEARIKEAEVRMHEINLWEKRRTEWKKNLMIGLKITIPIIIVLILMIVIGSTAKLDTLWVIGVVGICASILIWLCIEESYEKFIKDMNKAINGEKESGIHIDINGKQLKIPNFNPIAKKQKKPRK